MVEGKWADHLTTSITLSNLDRAGIKNNMIIKRVRKVHALTDSLISTRFEYAYKKSWVFKIIVSVHLFRKASVSTNSLKNNSNVFCIVYKSLKESKIDFSE